MLLYLQDGHDFGIDWEGPFSHENCDEWITIPPTPNPLTRVNMAELQAIIYQPSIQYGVDTYERVLQFVNNLQT